MIFLCLLLVILGLFSGCYCIFAPKRSHDTLVGDVKQKAKTGSTDFVRG